MKKVFIAIIAAVAVCVSMSVNGQEIKRNGNTFSSVSSGTRAPKDTLVTKFTWEDSKGEIYKIIVNKGSGSCYIWKKSAKTGKMYKQYMKKDVSKTICKELGITYVEKK